MQLLCLFAMETVAMAVVVMLLVVVVMVEGMDLAQAPKGNTAETSLLNWLHKAVMTMMKTRRMMKKTKRKKTRRR